MQEVNLRSVPYLLQGITSRVGCPTSLRSQGLPERMVTVDKELISNSEPLKVAQARHRSELAFHTAVAVLACQHQIPHSIHISIGEFTSQAMRDEMIDIRQVFVT